MSLPRVVTKLTAPLSRRVRLMARRAVLKLIYDDVKMQEVQVELFAGEVRDRVERWEDYGLTSHPLPGAEALVLALGGCPDHSAVIKIADRRYRLQGLAAGEVALYDDLGQSVVLKRGRIMEINTDVLRVNADTRVELLTPLVQYAGDLAGTGELGSGDMSTVGDVSDHTRSLADDRSIYNGHTHPGDSGGTTGAPNQQQ